VRLQTEFPGACVSYKAQGLAGKTSLPEGVKMVFFHGKPMPHEVGEQWMKEHWC